MTLLEKKIQEKIDVSSSLNLFLRNWLQFRWRDIVTEVTVLVVTDLSNLYAKLILSAEGRAHPRGCHLRHTRRIQRFKTTNR